MHINARIQRWVIWWFYVGVIGGIIVVANLFGHNLTLFQERLLLVVGAAFWVLGGLVCWAYEGVALERRAPPPQPLVRKLVETDSEKQWHPASDFLLPGRRKSLLPWRH